MAVVVKLEVTLDEVEVRKLVFHGSIKLGSRQFGELHRVYSALNVVFEVFAIVGKHIDLDMFTS